MGVNCVVKEYSKPSGFPVPKSGDNIIEVFVITCTTSFKSVLLKYLKI